ncbi:unnamed protein product [Gulo gulo]|uniref:Integrator complex subunit 9 n=1 Tax=Gulo gulo TaxID=48420 RepID=A0A9X9QAI6_GULGU|nr:unnamed protein product [Gulo gulo]
MQEVNSALSKIQLVGYSQKIELFGAVQVTPLSSGYALGSSNWIIQSHYEKVSYVSGSSLLTTHPQPMDQASLKNSDVLILTGLTQIPTANPDGMVGEFCSNLALTVRNGGNVLVPCYPSGVIYDLLECLYQYIDSAGLSNIPFYFISPVANSSLEFSQIFAEWLCHNKQTKVYLPEPPFPHAELIQTNKLKHYPSLHGDFSSDFRQPCVVFTGHPSLRFGDVVHFMELWGKSSLNTVIFTEPDFSYLEALAPYQPLAMKCIYCPIDTRLNFIQVSKLLKEVQVRKGSAVSPRPCHRWGVRGLQAEGRLPCCICRLAHFPRVHKHAERRSKSCQSSQMRWCPWRLSPAFPWQPSPLCCTPKITSTSFSPRPGRPSPAAVRRESGQARTSRTAKC